MTGRAAVRVVTAALALATTMVVPPRAGAAPPPSPPPPVAEPEGPVRLSWTGDPSTSMTLRWQPATAATAPLAQYRPLGSSAWITAEGVRLPAAGPVPAMDEVTFTELSPGTAYEYRVTAGPADWNNPRQFTTALDTGAVDAVFVADTGIVGRGDGHAHGTQQVLDEIVALAPTVVLGGGDYASVDTETRFDDQAGAIEAWLDQMEPITSVTSFMPTYGDHEVLLEEDVDQWIARFATPEGHAGGRFYSFDVGDVHFVSILAAGGPLDAAAVEWLEQDLAAAREAGATHIVPYLHQNAYGDGTVHPPNVALRRQLPPLFQQYGVDVVLTAHDQSYERTYPLRDGAVVSRNLPCHVRGAGITWVKSSPGGKLSDVTWSFSDFDPDRDPTVGVRERTLHHFTSVASDGAGALVVTTYGVAGNGSPPVVVDRFRYADECEVAPSFAAEPVLVAADPGVPVAPLTLPLVPGSGTPTVTSSAPWLGAEVAADGLSVLATVDVAALAPGVHVAQVAVSEPGTTPSLLPITVDVRGSTTPAQLVLLNAGDPPGPLPLDGATVAGDVAVALVPAPGQEVGQVLFLLDGRPYKREGGAPFDFNGDGAGGPAPFDTTELDDGVHVIEARVVAPDGTSQRAIGRFTVANEPPPPASTPPTTEAPSGPFAGVVSPLAPVDSGGDGIPWRALAMVVLAGALGAVFIVAVLWRLTTRAATSDDAV